MALVVDTRAASSVHLSTNSVADSFTINNASPVVFSISFEDFGKTLSSFTWNGVAADSITQLSSGGGTQAATAIARFKNPATGTFNAVATFSGAVTYIVFMVSTTGGDSTTGFRSAFTRNDVTGTGPGLTVTDSENGDLVFHAAMVLSSTITFDGGEDTTSTEDDAIGPDGYSGGLSTKSAVGANTVVGCTDVAFYSEIAISMIPSSSTPITGLGRKFLLRAQ